MILEVSFALLQEDILSFSRPVKKKGSAAEHKLEYELYSESVAIFVQMIFWRLNARFWKF